jgi:mono/diheme cytochrome c family protein
MNIRYCSLFIGSTLVLVGFLGTLAMAQTKVVKEVNAHSDGTFKGADLYREYCAVCHGTDGKGNGPAASALKSVPSDLTLLARQHSGKFPALEMQSFIKGDREIAAHGTLDMPVWGDIFKSISSNRTFAEMRVNSLVTYLKEMQR